MSRNIKANMTASDLDSLINAKYVEYHRNNNSNRRKFNGDVDLSTNHKSTKLRIVEEDDLPDSQSHTCLQVPDSDQLSSAASSAEHLAANTRANQQSSFNHLHSSNRLNNIPEDESSTQRRPSLTLEMQEMVSSRRPSAVMASLRRGSQSILHAFRGKHEDPNDHIGSRSPEAVEFRRKNRRIGDDALSTALSALYAKMVVILGIALPITEILSNRIPAEVYQGFYVYLYFVSIAFVVFVYASKLRSKAVQTIIKNYHAKTSDVPKKKSTQFGSFYLRIGAIAFGIGTMVYSGIELGQYFELESGDNNAGCHNIFMLLTPLARMILSIAQMQFIFLNTSELDMAKHKVISRFGLMHMVATNLCEWLYTLVEETKHEIWHLSHSAHNNHDLEKKGHHSHEAFTEDFNNNSTLNTTHAALHNREERSIVGNAAYQDCQRTNIMGSLVQNASPFLFPCTIEYSLICAVILFEMWKQVRSIPEINKMRRSSQKPGLGHAVKSAYHFSIDCSSAHRGMFAGIVVIVLTIICLIMYFVLHEQPEYVNLAIKEVTYYEILIYTVCAIAVLVAFFKMRDLKFHKKSGHDPLDHHTSSIKLDCTLLVMAGIGVYVYGTFSIMGSVFALQDDLPGARDALVSETLSLVQVSLQTLFILNACWRRCKGAVQVREKPGRQIVTFLLVANISIWFVNTLIKGHASFRPSHLEFFGQWAWVIITHVSMPLAIFYRFHSTICLFDIWKSAYKFKVDH